MSWYCGSDPFGPLSRDHADLTPCMQSLLGIVPPAVMLIAAVIQTLQLKCSKQSIHLAFDESIVHLPRFPQIVCLLLSLTDCLLICFALIERFRSMYLLFWPALDFVAWISAVAITRMEHQSIESKHRVIGPRLFFFLSLLVTGKYAESSILRLIDRASIMPLDVLHFCRLALCIVLVPYIIMGIGRASDESVSESWTAPLTRSINRATKSVSKSVNRSVNRSINQDLEEGRPVVSSSTPVKTDKSMWNRFLSIGDQQAEESDDEDDNDQSHDSAHHSHNPFAASYEDSSNPFLEDVVVDKTNPFSVNDPSSNQSKKSKSSRPSVVSSMSAVDQAIIQTSSSLAKAPSPHAVNHPLKNAVVTVASIQTSQLAGRSVVQYQVRTKLDAQSLAQSISVSDVSDDEVSTLVNWKRYREFEGLHDSITVTARKCQVSAPCLPPQPKAINQTPDQSLEIQRDFETYCNAVIAQPLFRDDFAAFIGLDEKLIAIKQYVEFQKIAQATQQAKPSTSVRSTPRLTAISESQQPSSINQSMNGSQTTSSAPRSAASRQSTSQSINHTSAESVSAAGWTIIAISVVGFSRWNSPSGPSSKHPIYMTYDMKVTTSQSTNQSYVIHKKPSEILALRASMARYLTDVKQSSKLSSLLPHPNIKSDFKLDVIDIDAFINAAANVDIFFQSLINATAFQIQPLSTFLAKQPTNQSGGELMPHESGAKPIDSFDRAKKLWSYQVDNNQSNNQSTIQSTTAHVNQSSKSNSVTINIDGNGTTARRSRHSRNVSINQPNDPVSDQVANQSTGESRRRRALRESASLFPELGPSSPSNEVNEPINQPEEAIDAAHRFQVLIPSFEQADPTDSKSPIMYTIIIREFFSLTSFIEWQVVRRYRDFDRMHRVLQSMFADYDFPALPGKSSLRMKGGSKKGDAKLEARRAQLELYIQKIINVRAFQVDEFFAFFDLNNANRVFTVHTVTAANQ